MSALAGRQAALEQNLHGAFDRDANEAGLGCQEWRHQGQFLQFRLLPMTRPGLALLCLLIL